MSVLLVPAPAGLASLRAAVPKLLGLVFITAILALIALTVLIYNKAFTATATVDLMVTNVGDQLSVPADVKLRGLQVGQVTAERVVRGGAVAVLSLNPADLSLLPANIDAEILPKTLFGEKFVDLILPAHPSAARLHAGDTIGLDRSRAALEVTALFDNLLPLLQEVPPAQLNGTLTAIATALRGQENSLGQNLVAADRYFARFNPHLPALDTDIARLAVVSQDYAQATPDLLATLGNLSTNARTVVATQNQLAAFLAAGIGASGTAQAVLDRNANGLIELAASAAPTLGTLAQYSPEFSCLSGGLATYESSLNQAFHGGELHITLEDVPDRGPYTTANAPDYADEPMSGPACYGLPTNSIKYNYLYPGPPSSNAPPGTVGGPAGAGASPAADLSLGNVGPVGSPAEQRTISQLLGGGSVGSQGLEDVAFGPILRGTVVSTS